MTKIRRNFVHVIFIESLLVFQARTVTFTCVEKIVLHMSSSYTLTTISTNGYTKSVTMFVCMNLSSPELVEE